MSLSYCLYVLIALTPAGIIFCLHNATFTLLELAFVLLGGLVCALLSRLYICLVEKHIAPSDEMRAVEMVEVAEPKYIPIYIAYFVIAVSLENWFMFAVVFIIIYLLILKGKFSYFNPYLLFSGYHFYEVSIDPNKAHGQDTYAKFKVFLISKRKLKTTMQYKELIRLNDFVFLDQEEE
ncbi:hypothetical protein [Helicobacter bizzozeronii]|uniref:hypothetical protein n=1 Tax=Helicobacter bizzozeronii TaxID=56877 RepID=UPI000CF0B8B1|nr:hypothetical protein [Helicobacter bizzozeronii]